MTPSPCCKTKPRAATVVGAAVVPTLMFALLPKCPLCLAAYLTAIGVTAELAPAVRPLAFMATLVVVGAVIVSRSGKRARAE